MSVSTKRIDRIDVQHLNAVLGDRLRGLVFASSAIEATATIAPFQVEHDLGVVPEEVQFSPREETADYGLLYNIATTVYATDADRATWTADTATLRATYPSNVRIWFLVRAR